MPGRAPGIATLIIAMFLRKADKPSGWLSHFTVMEKKPGSY